MQFITKNNKGMKNGAFALPKKSVFKTVEKVWDYYANLFSDKNFRLDLHAESHVRLFAWSTTVYGDTLSTQYLTKYYQYHEFWKMLSTTRMSKDMLISTHKYNYTKVFALCWYSPSTALTC